MLGAIRVRLRLRLIAGLARMVADLCRRGGVARRSKISEGYSSSSRLAAAPISGKHPLPIYEMGSSEKRSRRKSQSAL
jgi:hypothetical protein